MPSDLGGRSASTDWSNPSSTLAVTQFYHGTSQDLTHLLGGNQDNATTGIIPQGPAPPAWKSLLNGDGGWTAMIPGSTTFYPELPGLHIYRVDYSNGAFTEVWPCMVTSDPACPAPTGVLAPYVVVPPTG